MPDKGLLNARQMNRLRVIEALYRNPASSRTEVAEYTALSRPTVSMLIEELEAAGSPAPPRPAFWMLGEERGAGGIVPQHEADESRPRQPGRPPVLMSLVP